MQGKSTLTLSACVQISVGNHFFQNNETPRDTRCFFYFEERVYAELLQPAVTLDRRKQGSRGCNHRHNKRGQFLPSRPSSDYVTNGIVLLTVTCLVGF